MEVESLFLARCPGRLDKDKAKRVDKGKAPIPRCSDAPPELLLFPRDLRVIQTVHTNCS